MTLDGTLCNPDTSWTCQGASAPPEGVRFVEVTGGLEIEKTFLSTDVKLTVTSMQAVYDFETEKFTFLSGDVDLSLVAPEAGQTLTMDGTLCNPDTSWTCQGASAPPEGVRFVEVTGGLEIEKTFLSTDVKLTVTSMQAVYDFETEK
ncbi:MAG: hypothetical protein GY820_34445, partial [Gammaproteobacteria bacterium]|nr:hypothetical protein [Gammaproteobacteria bacterium]